MIVVDSLPGSALRAEFGKRIQRDALLARHTAARIGGPADLLLVVEDQAELGRAASLLWDSGVEFIVLGAGSNVLVADEGVRGAVLINKARAFRFLEEANPPQLWAESGANFGLVARTAAGRGLSGLEWAAGIPGTVGGAVVGNAGAHGSDMSSHLIWAEVLEREGGRRKIAVDDMDYAYRSSSLKRTPGEAVVLAAQIRLRRDDGVAIEGRMSRYLARRKESQPPGASMGSMFKNPPGDFAGRLIDAAGLKGTRAGRAEISPLHGNFFLNHGGARAADVLELIELARTRVKDVFGVDLELEIELAGDWPAAASQRSGVADE